MVEFMLGCEVMDTEAGFLTPFVDAIAGGLHWKIAELLVKHGANVDVLDPPTPYWPYCPT